jgi:hypothetical protein
MEFTDWLLFLHIAAATMTVVSLVLMVAMLLASRGAPGTRALPVAVLSPLAGRLGMIGGLLVMVFGVWLAIDIDGYEVWDGWVLGALALWVVAAFCGERLGRMWANAPPADGNFQVGLHLLMAIALLLLLIDMIYKPGA